jgi:hypothetical protein
MGTNFSAGVAQTDITPPVGIAHAAWGAQTHERAAGIDLPLWATALALGDGTREFVLVDIDVVYLWEDAPLTRDAIADLTDLPRSNIRISYTHTHSGPVTTRDTWIDKGEEMIDPYLNGLRDQVAGVALEALQNQRPARIAGGAGTSGIAVNRRFERPEDGEVIVGRNQEGPVDHEVGVLRIDDTKGEPVAALVNYACHPITAGPDNDLVTPDYPGVLKRLVEDATGATCLFLQGAAGNVGPIHGVARDGIDEYKRLGRRLGHEVSRVWWEIEPRERTERYVGTLQSGAPLAIYEYDYPEEPDRPLTIATRTLELPLRDLPAPETLQAQYDEHVEQLESLREDGACSERIQEATMQSKRIALRQNAAEKYEGQTEANFELQVLAIGNDIALVSIPGEPFVQIGQEIKEQSPYEHTFFSGYSNENWAYIPVPGAYPNGGYEVDVTRFKPDAAEISVAESRDLLATLHT